MAIGLIVLAVTLKGTTTAGLIGMALNIVLLANATLLELVESWTNLDFPWCHVRFRYTMPFLNKHCSRRSYVR
jgi:hypothetical protein